MKTTYNVFGETVTLSDDLIKEYLRRTDVSEDILEFSLRSHIKCAKLHPDLYGTNLDDAVEKSIKEELELWEDRSIPEPHTS